MDIEAVLLNLLTNAYTACQQMQRERKIRVSVRPKDHNATPGFELIVADSGPGVADDIVNKIWDPLFTTKVDREGRQVGTGLGLTIVQAIVEDLKGTRAVTRDPDLKGARFTIWLPCN